MSDETIEDFTCSNCGDTSGICSCKFCIDCGEYIPEFEVCNCEEEE